MIIYLCVVELKHIIKHKSEMYKKLILLERQAQWSTYNTVKSMYVLKIQISTVICIRT